MTPENHFGGSFGSNEWLVDEMYESFLRDPNSVDQSWRDFFTNYVPKIDTNQSAGDSTALGKKLSGAPRGGTPPIPKSKVKTNHSSPNSSINQSEVDAQLPPISIQAPLLEKDVNKVTGKIVSTDVEITEAETNVADFKHTESNVADVNSEGIADDISEPIRGVGARVVQSMTASLSVPTATSVRVIPAKLLIDNRIVINNHLKRARGGKVSFTHLIGYAMIKALNQLPEMNNHYTELSGKPAVGKPKHINLGIAIDLSKPDGTRQLLVPSIKACEAMNFYQFWMAYEEVIKKARRGALSVEDFSGTTVSLTNPGTIGTVHSVPRLVVGQGLILGVGAMDYPAEFYGASEETLAKLAISKVVTLTSTYDHRIIQGAQSGDFLRIINELLLGNDFYDEVFSALRIPYVPIRWVKDISVTNDDEINKTARVQELINAYRVSGHLLADIDPLSYASRYHPDLDVVNHGLTLWDLDREFATGGFAGKAQSKLRHILSRLRDSYCRTVGIEYMHIESPTERKWLQEQAEVGAPHMSREEQMRILHKLNCAEAFETFLHTKFIGQKRFSLEGGESVIPLLDAIVSTAADAKLAGVCIGMPHRGRLNVLANVAGKSYGQIFQEFEGNYLENSVQGSGDVKYHLGTTGTFTSPTGETIQIYLAANPSHLEAVNPVLEGMVRAKQDKLNEENLANRDAKNEQNFSVLPILIHGDAAFSGQGVVAETLQMSQLIGYSTGGTINVVINNQIGFTTSPHAARSTRYATDVAKIVQAPVFHVNGDDPEACVRVARIAFNYREQFHRDVVIDMVCYRRRGHNEGDEPSFTQPQMYELIQGKRSTRKLYTEALVGRGDFTEADAEAMTKDFQEQLESSFHAIHNIEPEKDLIIDPPNVIDPVELNTAISENLARNIMATQVAIPQNFSVHPKLLPQLQRRISALDEANIDWASGEVLAFGSLLSEGHPIRLAGQDVGRGTFSNRHAVVIDKENGSEWVPLSALAKDKNRFTVVNSLLSEYAAMGFEYGYSVERENALVLWEGQFGDFASGAQTIIDEFISSSLQKWGERSSVVLLLPHGYEGQGPDHSSARIERFLLLAAEENMTVAQPSTPASYFHLLRWHTKNPARRPLIVFTPKSMLRLKAAASSLTDFTAGHFNPVIADPKVTNASRVIFCSGKIYHDLIAEREKMSEQSTAIVRLEQIYPFPAEKIAAEISKYQGATLLWVQDEPANQGPWPFISLQLSETENEILQNSQIRRVSRRATASPATGSHYVHDEEQKALLFEAFSR